MADAAFDPVPRRFGKSATRPRPAAEEAGLLDRFVDYLPAVLFYALIVPAGLTFSIGDFLLFAYRVLLILALPFLLFYFARRRHRLMLPDMLLIAGLLWMGVSFVYNLGFLSGLEATGGAGIDMVGAYLIGRVCIRDERDLARFLKLILPGLLLVGAVLVVESLTGSFRIANVLPNSVEGPPPYEYRLGLLRAYGPFQHAILGGLVMTSFLTLYLMLERNPVRRAFGIGAALAGFFTLSSAAIASLALQAALHLYRWGMKLAGFRNNWWALFWAAIVGIAMLELVSENGAVSVIIRYAALNPATGSYRLLIWEYGTANVASNPLFGIAYDEYERAGWMTRSVDNHWLLVAIRHGLPALVPLLAMPLALIVRLAMISNRLPSMAGVPYAAFMIALFSFTAMGITVAFWTAALAFFYFLVGCSAALVELYDKRVGLAARHRSEMRNAAQSQ